MPDIILTAISLGLVGREILDGYKSIGSSKYPLVLGY